MTKPSTPASIAATAHLEAAILHGHYRLHAGEGRTISPEIIARRVENLLAMRFAGRCRAGLSVTAAFCVGNRRSALGTEH